MSRLIRALVVTVGLIAVGVAPAAHAGTSRSAAAKATVPATPHRVQAHVDTWCC